ncbi:MAG TPA: UDP-N-acetylglucosamine 2-epimerase (non-hydrolyzing) [Elusimicrobiales bacterium]|nr:UDP-N-acetylglucosamine 2-epimerase (non-hydrolyzing) [Elusimicrobiales bacterium]
MKKMKLMTILGTRPDTIKLSRVIALADKHVNHILVHTGQNYDYELNQIFFEDMEIRKPDYFLNAKGTAAETMAKSIANIDPVLEKEKPDAVLLLGDTNSALACISAKRRKIPIFHMEAGNRCFDARVPEEINRKIVDHTSDINLPYTTIARDYLIAEGIPADRIIKTGSPMYEVLEYYKDKIAQSKIMRKLKLTKHGFFLVSAHREENIDSPANFPNFINMLNTLAKKFNKQVIVSTHPRTLKKIKAEKAKVNKLVSLLKPMGFSDYVKLQQNAFVVLSDSGTITEESSILDFPALNIRKAHERPEGMEEGSVMMTGLDLNTILRGIKILPSQRDNCGSGKRYLKMVADYHAPKVSQKVLRIILSYTDYVNRRVWYKAEDVK